MTILKICLWSINHAFEINFNCQVHPNNDVKGDSIKHSDKMNGLSIIRETFLYESNNPREEGLRYSDEGSHTTSERMVMP